MPKKIQIPVVVVDDAGERRALFRKVEQVGALLREVTYRALKLEPTPTIACFAATAACAGTIVDSLLRAGVPLEDDDEQDERERAGT